MTTPSSTSPAARAKPGKRTTLHRLLPAALVALLCASILGGIVGLASAGGGRDTVPERFTLPEARVGDQWSYDVTLDGDWFFGQDDTIHNGQRQHAADYQWLPESILRAGDGQMHVGNELSLQSIGYAPYKTAQFDSNGGMTYVDPTTAWGEDHNTAWFVPGQDTTWAIGANFSAHATQDGGLIVAGVPVPFRYSVDTHAQQRSFSSLPPCFARNPLQGHEVNKDEAVTLAACSFGGMMLFANTTTYEPAGVEPVGDLQAVRYHAKADPPTPNGLPRSEDEMALVGPDDLWFAPGIPYPVRVHFQHAGFPESEWMSGHGGHVEATLELTRYLPGDQPLKADDDLQERSPAPELVEAPRQPWGLDETGIDLPFTPAKAYAKALADPTFPGFAKYVAAHPDAYATSAHFFQSGDSTTYRRTMILSFTDGVDSYVLIADQQTPRFPSVPGLGDPTPSSVDTGVYSFNGFEHQATGYDAPASAAPETMPTAASLIARWEAYAGPAQAGKGNSWAFNLFCKSDCKASAMYMVGREAFDSGGVGMLPSIPGVASNMTMVLSELMLRNGTAIGFIDYDVGIAQAPSVVAGGAPQADQGVRDTRHPLLLAGIFPWPTSPVEATGVGIAAVLVGFLYWAWPALRGAPLALFSRVEEARLLDHPVRKRIALAIDANPGIHFQELRRVAAVSNGAAVHHLRKLAAAHLVTVRPSGGYSCYFPGTEAQPAAAAGEAAAVKSDGAQRVLEAIRAAPGLTGQDVALRVGLQPSTVHHHVQRLVAGGLVTGIRDGRGVRLHATSNRAATETATG